MKLVIQNKMFAVMSVLMGMHIIYALCIGLIVLLGLGLFTPLGSVNASMVFSLSLLGMILYLLAVAFNAKMFANSSFVELKDNSVVLNSKNFFKHSNVSLPSSQIESVNINQTFSQKLFKVCQISFLQESGVITSLWGFNIDDALTFNEEFRKKYKIPIK